MTFYYGKWYCSNCHSQSNEAHKQALADYALLINPYINNRQAREFLQLPTSHVTKRILQKANLDSIGATSGRRYRLEYSNLLQVR
ncbi:hypothetical protein [Virgibacillus sp. Bac332]|nr:hypothetical protein [Virgibacillus sp. Bac332]